MSARQCLKRLHLEIHRKDLRRISPATEAAFEAGHAIGELAHKLYSGENHKLISLDGGMAHALRKTERLLREGPRGPLFEATIRHKGLLVRVDVLLPDGNGWRMVEVKAATEMKEEYPFDCAAQLWVLRGAGYEISRVALAHVDNSFHYRGDGNYQGLLVENDISGEVERLLPGVPEWIRRASAASGELQPEVAVGSHCNKPYECPFMHHCWPSDSEFPVQQLPRARKSTLGDLIARGITDLRDVPAEELSDAQQTVQRVARSGSAELLPGAGEFARGLGYARYYLDFETIAPAIPIWADTRPYEMLPIQWSCHFERAPGELAHADFLDLSGEPPMRRLAESLIRVLGEEGPVLMYSTYERRVINALISRFADLAAPLKRVLARLVDLEPVARQNYYHPAMAGSWSLKAILPTVSADMNYNNLEGIQEGTAASKGYLEAIDSVTSEARREQLREQLLRYCEIDTVAMVRLVHCFAAAEQQSHGRAGGSDR